MSIYETLGVMPDADIDRINARYRALTKKHHPDAGGDSETFAALQRAIVILRDPEKRARYDATGDESVKPDNTRGEVIECLLSAFQEVVSGTLSVTTIDVIKSTRAVLDQRLNNLKANRSTGKAEQVKVQQLIGRLSHGGEGPDFIRGLLEGKAAEFERALAEIDRVEGVIAAAHELAAGYSWKVDPAPSQTVFVQGGAWSTGSNTTGSW